MGKQIQLQFITKPGCHLCDEAKKIIVPLLNKLESEGFNISFSELNMLEDESLIKKYSEDIPVVLINGRRHSYWHVDAQRLEKALRKQGY